MGVLSNIAWWKAALVRAIKTMAQVAASYVGTGVVGILDVDWVGFVSITIMAGVLSILTSVAGIPEVNTQDPADDEDLLEQELADNEEDDIDAVG